ncbi:MAG: phenylalanine--tRNA ligase beta subunit-related protein [Myxococcota bacterium]|nr:phenylalanine--tRNA ligase beta subunit-related protein [Myxococcota bacterium]
MLTVAPHPLLDLGCFLAQWPCPLGELPSPPWLLQLLRGEGEAPLSSDDSVRAAVRDLLRYGGYKPTGRGKPSAEYLLRAAAQGELRSINVAVDVGNAVSLHSGLPVSVVDAARTHGALRVALAERGQQYVFNPTGQVIDVSGLVCLLDEEGPCASPVKDAQRSKTAPDTVRTLQIVWGTRLLGDRTARTVAWYRELLAQLGVGALTPAAIRT